MAQARAVSTPTHAASGGDVPPLGFSNVPLGGTWATPARVGGFSNRTSSRNPTVPVVLPAWRAGVDTGGKVRGLEDSLRSL